MKINQKKPLGTIFKWRELNRDIEEAMHLSINWPLSASCHNCGYNEHIHNSAVIVFKDDKQKIDIYLKIKLVDEEKFATLQGGPDNSDSIYVDEYLKEFKEEPDMIVTPLESCPNCDITVHWQDMVGGEYCEACDAKVIRSGSKQR